MLFVKCLYLLTSPFLAVGAVLTVLTVAAIGCAFIAAGSRIKSLPHFEALTHRSRRSKQF